MASPASVELAGVVAIAIPPIAAATAVSAASEDMSRVSCARVVVREVVRRDFPEKRYDVTSPNADEKRDASTSSTVTHIVPVKRTPARGSRLLSTLSTDRQNEDKLFTTNFNKMSIITHPCVPRPHGAA